MFTAIIGQGTTTNVGFSATFDSINWGASNHLLKVEINDGTGYIDMGTTAFMSVPYALQAGTSVDDSDSQTLSVSGDTLFISNGNYVVIPGLNLAGDLIEYGCMDSIDCNYNPIANTDDGSCDGYSVPANLMLNTTWQHNWLDSCGGSITMINEYIFYDTLSYHPNHIGMQGSSSWGPFSWSLCDSMLVIDHYYYGTSLDLTYYFSN